MNYGERIIRDDKICGGAPIIKGTRVTLRTILACLADGETPDTIITAFPTLTKKDVYAVIAFAATSALEDIPFPGIPKVA